MNPGKTLLLLQFLLCAATAAVMSEGVSWNCANLSGSSQIRIA